MYRCVYINYVTLLCHFIIYSVEGVPLPRHFHLYALTYRYTGESTSSSSYSVPFRSKVNNNLSVPVGGPDFVQLDLFDSLHLHNSTYSGVSLGMGIHTLSPGVLFTGEMRETIVSGDWAEKVRGKFREIGANEFTISAIVKQSPNNVGTLLAFSRGLSSALEIQSSGRKNELRVISGSLVETFPFRLADGSWHRLAISFSAAQVEILVDCQPLYRRVLRFDPATAIFSSSNMSLWIGQRTTSHFLYQGAMQDLRLTFGPHGYLSQCPQIDSTCPTCSDYTTLKLSFASLQAQFQLLSDRLTRVEARLNEVEECECNKSCRINETLTVNDGTKWNQNCENCTCHKGEIECRPVQCPLDPCQNPTQRAGECCPKCQKCYRNQVWFDEGEVTFRECAGDAYYSRKCKCEDGSLKCNPMEPITSCPPLSCPVSEQISIPEECCKICPGTDYCASHGNKCHANATCVNLQTTFMCHCNAGFVGDGKSSCEDIDECLPESRNHCNPRSTLCVNTPGSYFCQCLNGFKRLDQFNCQDEDECAPGGVNQCHPNAICENTKGSYNCPACKEGYTGNGFQCSPICNRTCENGGICLVPDVCSCRAGWTGEFCETDIDECSEARNISLEIGMSDKTNLCPAHASCVNKPGWYHCQCDEGFEATLISGETARCQDVDECEENDVCGSAQGMKCFNTIGSYECHCLDSNKYCSRGCFEGGKSYSTGSTWFSEDCNVCSCSAPGTTTCHPTSDDACQHLCYIEGSNNIESPHHCCDTCANTNLTQPLPLKSCRHQLYPEMTYKSGETWHFRCETCECLNGEIDCWKLDCPPLNCANPVLPPGDCCYRCPDDKCTHTHRNSSYLDECNLLETKIKSGTQITLPHNHCISCKCHVPLCAKSVSYNEGICVLRMDNSAALMTMTASLVIRRMIQLS